MKSILSKIVPPRKIFSFFNLLPWIWLVAAYCITFGFLALHGRAYIDSDMASEMVLADLLNQEGGILSTNWGYSTELRVVYLQILYRIALLIFPNNWYAARVLGQAVLMLLLLFSYFYAARGIGLKNSGVWGAAALACPFGIWYFWYGPFGGFYIPHMILFLLSFGLAVRIALENRFSVKVLHLILLGVVSFLNGLGSVKGIMALYLPMAAAAVMLILFSLHQQPDRVPKTGLRYLVVSLYTLIFAAIGYLINSKILAAKYDFAGHNDRIWENLDLVQLINTWCDFLSLFGFQSSGTALIDMKVELFSIFGVLGALSIVIVLFIAISIYVLVLRSKKLPPEFLMVFFTFVSICLVQGAVFAFTGGSDIPNASYWLTPVPLVFMVLQTAWETTSFRIPHAREGLAVIFMVSIIGVSLSSVHSYFANPPRAVPKLESVADWLTENGYTNGYASFWNCNVMTEWSSGQLDMRSVNEYTLDVTEPHSWLERLDHATPPEGKVFLLVSAQELWGAHKESLRNDYNVYWDENDYLVMAFDNYDTMVSAIESAHADG